MGGACAADSGGDWKLMGALGGMQSMLKFMVSSSAGVVDASDRPNKAVSQLLVQSGLMSYR